MKEAAWIPIAATRFCCNQTWHSRPVICLRLMLHAISLELAGRYKAELLCQLLSAAINEALRHLSGVVHAVQPVPVTAFGNLNVKTN